MRILTAGFIAAGAASLAGLLTLHGLIGSTAFAAAGRQPARNIFLDLGVTDDTGRTDTTLRPQDVRVTVDGERRQVVSLRFVYRGPGAEAAARLADPSRDGPAASERARSLVLLLDENSVEPGQQKAVVAAVNRLLDELGGSDHVAVATLPRPPAQLVLSANQAERRSALAGVIGRSVAGPLAPTPVRPLPAADTSDPSSGGGGASPDAPTERDLAAAGAGQLRQQGSDDDGEEGSRLAASVRALLGIVDGLAALPGLKTLVVFRQVQSATDAAAPPPLSMTSSVLSSAARARVVIHLVEVGRQPGRFSDRNDEMRAIAVGSGGTITAARSASDSKAFDGIGAALGGGYLVEVDGRDSDGASSRLHAVRVESTRPKTTIRAPRLWTAREDPVPAVVAAGPASSAPAASGTSAVPASPPPAGRPQRRTPANDRQLALLLARLTEYVAAYIRDLGNVVAEEDYYQRLLRGGSGRTAAAHLKSDLLLVATEDDIGWTQYRDVFEVDGRQVRDREARVQKLFLENPANAPRLAREISDEGARYNIGSQTRNVNRPALPLEYLSPARIGGLSFWHDGDDSIDGVSVVKLGFEEMARPSLVRSDNTGDDVPASGVFWIDPANGRILRTLIKLRAGIAEMTTSVVYKPAEGLGLLVPSQMNERYYAAAEDIEGIAVYRNFRSFKVTTEVKIAK